MRLLAVLLLSSVCALPGLAQDLTLQAVPGTFDVLPGEPIAFDLRITNHSGKDLQVIRNADHPPFGFVVAMDMLSPAGKKIACCSGGSPYILPATTPPSTWPKTLLKAGEIVTQQSGMWGAHPCCPLSNFPPGDYIGQVRVRADIWEGSETLRTTEATVNVSVHIRAAQGEDAAFIQAVQQAVQDHEASGDNRLKGVPLRWQDLLIMPRVASREIALSRFPCSTYAALVFAKEFGGPGPVAPTDKPRMRQYLMKLGSDGRAELQDRTRHFATGPDGKELRDLKGQAIPITNEEWLKQTINRAQLIVSAHPELPVSEWIRSQVIAPYYIMLLDYPKAASVLDYLSAKASDPVIRQNSQDVLTILQEMKLIEPRQTSTAIS